MDPTNRKAYLVSAVYLLAFFALLYAFFATLRKNVEPVLEPVALVGPGTYIDPEADPVQARIGVFVNSVGNLELTTGQYFMDFYLTILCDRPCQPDPDILNAAAPPQIERQNADTQGGTVHFYRVRADLLTQVHLENFPFDEQVLYLEVGDKQANKEQMQFVGEHDDSGWNYGNLHLLGWYFKPGWETLVGENAYPVNLGGNYSRFLFSVTIYKPWLSSFINNIFPILVIMLVGFLAFLMKPDVSGERLALTSSTLLALILFHINLNSSIPPLNTLTFADKFMILNYIAAGVSTGIAAVLLVLNDNRHHEAAESLNAWTRWIVPLVWVVLLLLLTHNQFTNASGI